MEFTLSCTRKHSACNLQDTKKHCWSREAFVRQELEVLTWHFKQMDLFSIFSVWSDLPQKRCLVYIATNRYMTSLPCILQKRKKKHWKYFVSVSLTSKSDAHTDQIKIFMAGSDGNTTPFVHRGRQNQPPKTVPYSCFKSSHNEQIKK